jgi:hypothetical protein
MWELQIQQALDRQQDLLRGAQRERLVRQAVSDNSHPYDQALVWLGYRLVAWGRRLQARGSSVRPSEVTSTARVAQAATVRPSGSAGYISRGAVASQVKHK